MAFEKNSFSGKSTDWADLVLGQSKKQPDLPFPNLRFRDDQGVVSHLIAPGENPSFNLTGKVSYVGIKQVAGYNDNQAGKGEKNAYRMIVVMDDGSGRNSGVGFEIVNDVGVPDNRVLPLVSALVTLLDPEGDYKGKDTPVQIGLYAQTVGDKTYPRSIIRLPTAIDENGVAQFDDPKNFVRSELPPQALPKEDAQGNQIKHNGQIVREYGPVLEWTDKALIKLTGFFAKAGEPSDAPEAAAEQDGGANPADAFDENEPARERQGQVG